MKQRVIVCVVLVIVIKSAAAAILNSGNISVIFSDADGKQITDATVRVKTSNVLGWSVGGDSGYAFHEAKTDKNGVATVAFKYLHPDFEWSVVTPSHYSRRFTAQKECFDVGVDDEAFYDSDADDGNAVQIVNEIKAMGEVKDIGGYTNLIAKLSAMPCKGGGAEIIRTVSFFPRRNPQPMCSYTKHLDTTLPIDHFELVKENGIEVKKYMTVGFDMRLGKILLLDGGQECRFGDEMADFKVVRYHVTTNNVDTLYGWIEFAPGCGAYKMKKTGNASFPSTYEANTNAIFSSKIPFEYHCSGGRFWEEKSLLAKDEYMVLRTRAQLGDSGAVTNCHYSKIIGEMWAAKDLYFNASIFNPRPNDNNLEFDMSRNMAKEFGGNGGVYCP